MTDLSDWKDYELSPTNSKGIRDIAFRLLLASLPSSIEITSAAADIHNPAPADEQRNRACVSSTWGSLYHSHLFD